MPSSLSPPERKRVARAARQWCWDVGARCLAVENPALKESARSGTGERRGWERTYTAAERSQAAATAAGRSGAAATGCRGSFWFLVCERIEKLVSVLR